ncbi:MAG: hypothetical protein HQM10_00120 [Candidatus Riflebacteria bacterium]|nr:hypothetical protein [Candidatus Riflebacteria bacterium]
MNEVEKKFMTSTDLLNDVGRRIQSSFSTKDEIEIGKNISNESLKLQLLWKENLVWLNKINLFPKGIVSSTAKVAVAVKYRDSKLRSRLMTVISDFAEFYKILKLMKEFACIHN